MSVSVVYVHMSAAAAETSNCSGNEVKGSCESPDTDARNGIQVLCKNSRHS